MPQNLPDCKMLKCSNALNGSNATLNGAGATATLIWTLSAHERTYILLSGVVDARARPRGDRGGGTFREGG